jgi:outer membrane immunogenic protein
VKNRIAIGLFATVLMNGVSLAADLPVTLPQLYRPTPSPVEWTGLYFGVNAGYGWAQDASNIVFTGFNNQAGLTNPITGVISGTLVQLPGPTELSGTRVLGSGSLNGGIAGGQIGFNWQSGMAVFGAELDGQWSGQQSTFTVNCGAGCTANESVKIRSLVTGRARVGLAFDWIMPYVTAGAALVNGIDNLTMTVGGVTASFMPLSGSTLGWTAGGGVEIALWSSWSAKFEYLYISANGLNVTAPIPNALGTGIASTPREFRDNIVRVGKRRIQRPDHRETLLRIASACANARRLRKREVRIKASDKLPNFSKFATRQVGEPFPRLRLEPLPDFSETASYHDFPAAEF